MNIVLKDFQPVNKWVVDQDGPKWKSAFGLEPKFLVDLSTNKKYLNESTWCVRFKCFLLTLGSPIVHLVAAIANIAYRTLKIISLSHLWMPNADSKKFKDRIRDAGIDMLRIIASPFTYFALELSALYGLVSPYNGRKLYASFERAVYGNFILAPCFQPEAKYHALGGDIDKKNAF